MPGYRVDIVAADRYLFERIRASLSRSPFVFSLSSAPLPDEQTDLRVAPIDAIESLPEGSPVPFIAYGPGSSVRRAYLEGCADYIKEPWVPEELGLRALAVLERTPCGIRFPWGFVRLEGSTLVAPCGSIVLTHREARILRVLLLRRGSPVGRSALALQAWGFPLPAGSRRIDVHVAGIRRKVAEAIPAAGRLIVSVRREGYMVP